MRSQHPEPRVAEIARPLGGPDSAATAPAPAGGSSEPQAAAPARPDPDRDALKEVLKKEEITWRSFWNGKEGTMGPIAKKWNVHAWPTLYVLDHKGIIRHKWEGSPGDKVMDEAIEKLVKEAKGGEKKESK